jgi:polysaccharide export outer membrane protein
MAMVLLASCVSSRQTNYLQNISSSDSLYRKIDSVPDYTLQIGDRVFVRISTLNKESSKLFGSDQSITPNSIYGNNELYSYTIAKDGCIDFPFVGAIRLQGLTAREAKDAIQHALRPFIPDCDVDVRLTNGFFSVIGVAGSGRYPIGEERLNVFQALAISGDLKPFSDRKKIFLLRSSSDGTRIESFDVRRKDIIGSEFYYIRPNDVIYVQAIRGQFFGIESFSSLLTTISSSLSFGYLIYDWVFGW